MKASKFTDAQKAFIIRQGEGGTRIIVNLRAGVGSIPAGGEITPSVPFGLSQLNGSGYVVYDSLI